MIAYYSSKSGNTHTFIEKLGRPSFRIAKGVGLIGQPFLLVTPTFADPSGLRAVPPSIIAFLNQVQNRELMRGVIGSGNRNFGRFFAQGGKEVAARCRVPLLYTFELSGLNRDVEAVNEIYDRLLGVTYVHRNNIHGSERPAQYSAG